MLLNKILRGIGHELTVPTTNDNHGINANGLHVLEILIPLFFSPVLVRNVMGYLIQKSTGYLQSVVLRNDERATNAFSLRIEQILCFCQLVGSLCYRGHRYSCSCECRLFDKFSSIDHCYLFFYEYKAKLMNDAEPLAP